MMKNSIYIKRLKNMLRYWLIFYFISLQLWGQNEDNKKWFSLGMRSTMSVFSDDGFGIGTGGQFRVQLSKRVNTDWFADYITINLNDEVKSEYAHIGWSVLYYPFQNMLYPHFFQPYILAGHCFDYNKKSSILKPDINKDRWGSAIQAGLGTHLNFTKRADVSLMLQYMIHLTSEIHYEYNNINEIEFHTKSSSTLEGHLLFTISVNYKLFCYGK
ncbi:MAG: hypothetical protein OHK0036_06870 [Bacteroidia bacterium]